MAGFLQLPIEWLCLKIFIIWWFVADQFCTLSGRSSWKPTLARGDSPFKHQCSVKGNLLSFSPFRPTVEQKKSSCIRPVFGCIHTLLFGSSMLNAGPFGHPGDTGAGSSLAAHGQLLQQWNIWQCSTIVGMTDFNKMRSARLYAILLLVLNSNVFWCPNRHPTFLLPVYPVLFWLQL